MSRISIVEPQREKHNPRRSFFTRLKYLRVPTRPMMRNGRASIAAMEALVPLMLQSEVSRHLALLRLRSASGSWQAHKYLQPLSQLSRALRTRRA